MTCPAPIVSSRLTGAKTSTERVDSASEQRDSQRGPSRIGWCRSAPTDEASTPGAHSLGQIRFFPLFDRPVALFGTSLVAMSYFTVLLSAAANAQVYYVVYLMAEQRIDVLSKRLQAKIQDESRARVADALVDRADVLLARIEQVLQHMSEKDAPGPRGTAIAWLAQRRCRKS